MSKRRILYSTVIDNSELFLIQGYLWAKSLIENANIDTNDILINVIDDHTLDLDALNQLGIHIALSPRFGDGRYCNKAGQIDNLISINADYYVLMDADTFICDDLNELILDNFIRGKVVDIANPRITVLDELYMQARFVARPDTLKSDLNKMHSTYNSNLNGGLYIIPSQYVVRINECWKKWILWILEHPNILDQVAKLHHTDQVAFSMTLEENRIPLKHVSRKYNFPCHLYVAVDETPVVLHYHHLLNEEGIRNENEHLRNYSAILNKANTQILIWKEELEKKLLYLKRET